MAVGVWCLVVGGLTLVNVALARASYRHEKNRAMPARLTITLAVLLAAAYAISARAIETG